MLPAEVCYLQHGEEPVTDVTDTGDEETDDNSDEDDTYDHSYFDDDGLPLIDEYGQALIPFDPDKEIAEEEALYLCSFAATYREVRGKLQANRIGRDQRVVKRKQKGQHGGKGGKAPPSA